MFLITLYGNDSDSSDHATLSKFKKIRILGWWSYSTIFMSN
jgi:hypothetical protein